MIIEGKRVQRCVQGKYNVEMVFDGVDWMSWTGEYRLLGLPDAKRVRDLIKDGEWVLESEGVWALDGSREKSIMIHETVGHPPRAVYDVMSDWEYLKKVKTKAQLHPLRTLSHNNDIFYYRSSPSAPRDYCMQRGWFEFDNGDFVLLFHPVAHRDAPAPPKTIRGEASYAMYVTTTSELQSDCRVTCVVRNVDFPGCLPKSLRGIVTSKVAKDFFKQLSCVTSQHRVQHHPLEPPAWTVPLVSWGDDLQSPLKLLLNEEKKRRVCLTREEEAVRRECLMTSNLPQMFDVNIEEVAVEEVPLEGGVLSPRSILLLATETDDYSSSLDSCVSPLSEPAHTPDTLASPTEQSHITKFQALFREKREAVKKVF